MYPEQMWTDDVAVSGTDRQHTHLQVRLVEEETSYCSYGEAYEVNCARYGREADQPISHFKKRCCSPNGNLISDPDGALRLQVCRIAAPQTACLHKAPCTLICMIYLQAFMPLRACCYSGKITGLSRVMADHSSV